MKLLMGTFVIGAAVVGAFGQDVTETRPTPPVPPTPPSVVFMAAAGEPSVIRSAKGVPFTADESGETVRILADGNRVTENWSGKIARNSQGSIRRQTTSGTAGGRPIIVSGREPAVGQNTYVFSGDDNAPMALAKIEAEKAVVAARAVAPLAAGTDGVSVVRLAQASEELRAVSGAFSVARADGVAPVAMISGEGMTTIGGVKQLADSKFQTRKESLGSRDFSGVSADGVRTFLTIPAGTIGNDRDIEIVSESWFSKELGVVVYSKRSDPRTGESTYQMTNIVRAEPDASMFPGK